MYHSLKILLNFSNSLLSIVVLIVLFFGSLLCSFLFSYVHCNSAFGRDFVQINHIISYHISHLTNKNGISYGPQIQSLELTMLTGFSFLLWIASIFQKILGSCASILTLSWLKDVWQSLGVHELLKLLLSNLTRLYTPTSYCHGSAQGQTSPRTVTGITLGLSTNVS